MTTQMTKTDIIKSGLSVCPMINHGLLKVAGQDAKRFLQGQLTCDLDNLKSGESVMGACCNAQGRVISNFVINLAEDQQEAVYPVYYLSMDASVVSLLQDHLKKYAVFFKVTMASLVNTHCAYVLLGEKHSVMNLCSQKLQDIILAYQQGKDFIAQYWFAKNDTDNQAYWQQYLTACHDQSWQRSNIAYRLAYIQDKTSGQFTPHMLNLDQLGAISFSKGCYTGQEIVARTHYRGLSKKQTHCIVFIAMELPQVMADIYNNHAEPCGTITAVCSADSDSCLLGEMRSYSVLAVINRPALIHDTCYLDPDLTIKGHILV